MARSRIERARGRELGRKTNVRRQNERVLIITEGKKTEPNYFNEIRQIRRLPTTTIMVLQSPEGTDPKSVLEGAIHIFKNGDAHKRITPRAFDKVYIVFDRDQHESYAHTLQRLSDQGVSCKNDEKIDVVFTAIPSNPSFEYWLLLHFENCTNLKHRREILHALKKHLPNYEKGANTIFEQTKNNLAIATARANAINEISSPMNEELPYTDVPMLVNELWPASNKSKE
ncbi:MAG: RloB family protein [Pseudomonadota bacterium]